MYDPAHDRIKATCFNLARLISQLNDDADRYEEEYAHNAVTAMLVSRSRLAEYALEGVLFLLPEDEQVKVRAKLRLRRAG